MAKRPLLANLFLTSCRLDSAAFAALAASRRLFGASLRLFFLLGRFFFLAGLSDFSYRLSFFLWLWFWLLFYWRVPQPLLPTSPNLRRSGAEVAHTTTPMPAPVYNERTETQTILVQIVSSNHPLCHWAALVLLHSVAFHKLE